VTLVIAIVLVVIGKVQGGWAVALVAGTATLEASQNAYWLWYSQRRAAQVGAETLLGRVVEVAEECRPYGHVRVQGELWRARCAEGAASSGERVRIVGRDGLTLEVKREPD
jgi:membrane protein implicated in regulation of membrane protease activity